MATSLSAVIAQLNAIYAQCGDIPVLFETPEGAAEVHSISVSNFTEVNGLYKFALGVNGPNIQTAVIVKNP
jgi:hypothetical protein